MAVIEYTKQGNVPFAQPDLSAFVEMLDEKLIKFSEFGQAVSGRIFFVRKVTVKGQSAVECGLQTTTGRVKFFLNHDLQQKIDASAVGRLVLIVYDRDEDTGQESKMRKYRVWLSKSTPGAEAASQLPKVHRGPEDVGITDDDIPF